jgi:hypothetical protein
MLQAGQRQGIGIAIAYARGFLQQVPSSAAQLTSLRTWNAAQQSATSTPSLGAAFHSTTTCRLPEASRNIFWQGGGAKWLLQPSLPSCAAQPQHTFQQGMHSAASRSLLGKPHPCRAPAGHSAHFRVLLGRELAYFSTSARMLPSSIGRGGLPGIPRTLMVPRLLSTGLGSLGLRGFSHHARHLPLSGWGTRGVGASGLKGLGAAHGGCAGRPAGVRGFAASPRQRARVSGGDSAAQGLYLLALVVLMIGLTYASVPLYR